LHKSQGERLYTYDHKEDEICWVFPWKEGSVWHYIQQRKALEVALDWLEQVATPEKCDDDLCREFTKRKLAEIKTALEQKD
jgi:hypothetical protein